MLMGLYSMSLTSGTHCATGDATPATCEGTGFECVICFLSIKKQSELRQCACSSGNYHANCIKQWVVNYKSTCPICLRSGESLNLKLSDFQDTGINSLLSQAVQSERADLTKLLLGFSADPNQRLAKYPLLTYALLQRSFDVAKALLQDPRTKRQKALFFVVAKGIGEQGIQVLLENGISVNHRDTNGRTALMYAVEGCKKRDRSYSFPGSEYFADTSMDVVKRLLTSGAKVNARDCKGQTALMLATHSLDLTKLLVNYGANVNAKNILGETALRYTSTTKEVADYLVSQGAVTKSRKTNLPRFWKSRIFKIAKRKSSKPRLVSENQQPF